MSNAEKRNLVFTRVFNAPVERVWKAWTDAYQVMQWWGPDHFTSPSAEMDVREGGVSIVCMRAPKEWGGQDMYSSWAYTKIVPFVSIEFIQNLCDREGDKVDPAMFGLPADFPQDLRKVVTFTPAGPGKTELIVTEFDWTVGQMMVLAETGMNQCLGKMEASFARQASAGA